MKQVKWWIIVGLSLILSACARPQVLIERAVVVNLTGQKVANVSVQHLPSQKFGAVNAILPGQSLDIGLANGGVPLRAKKAVLQWQDGTGSNRSVTLAIPGSSKNGGTDKPHELVYTLFPAGHADVKITAAPRWKLEEIPGELFRVW